MRVRTLCVCVCVYMYAHICICVCVYTCACMCVCVDVDFAPTFSLWTVWTIPYLHLLFIKCWCVCDSSFSSGFSCCLSVCSTLHAGYMIHFSVDMTLIQCLWSPAFLCDVCETEYPYIFVLLACLVYGICSAVDPVVSVCLQMCMTTLKYMFMKYHFSF